MSLKLGESERQFTRMVGELIAWAYAHGYELSFGEAWRTPEQSAYNVAHGLGIGNSLHRDRLAVDFNLFRDGVFLSSTSDHLPLGVFWEGLGGSWGGRFSKPDGNHYSLSWGGRT